MARKRVLSSVHPYHLFNRVNNREWFPLEMSQVWAIFEEEAYYQSLDSGLLVHGMVLMSNHFHLKATTPERPLGLVMRDFMRSVAQTLNRYSGRSGHIFGGPYKSNLIDTPEYASTVLKYIYRNPVKAGVVGNAEDYPFSTLNGLFGGSRLRVRLESPLNGAGDLLIPEDPNDFLKWINTPFKNEEEEAIQKGLRRRIFQPSKAGFNRKAVVPYPTIAAPNIRK